MSTQVERSAQAREDAPWWRQAVVYQIYPRSFADSNNDGLGDLQGIISRADYLAGLGIDAVWLSPFYPSALADGGYDVDDYRDVDPRLGSLEDFDLMLLELHRRNIKVIIDIVPNHTSNRHRWFKEALAAGPGSAARERYIFREGKGPDGTEPPSDWISEFGGPAWTRVEDGQWYLHMFASEQPDLNWENREVRDEFLDILKFWADRGVDGFRIDVANALAKDLSEPLPTLAEIKAMPTNMGVHPFYDRDEVQDIYVEWRELFNRYDPPRTAVAEAWVDSDRVPRYANPNSLGQCFNFDLLEADFDAPSFKRIIDHHLEMAETSESSSTWVLSNHDVVRHPTRYGLPNPARSGWRPDVKHGSEWLASGGTEPELLREQGERRANAATLMILGLPGSTYIYNGEELGLHEVAEISAEERQDPTFFRTRGAEIGRDGCRVPLPWEPEGDSFGFGEAFAHLPQPGWFRDFAVAALDADPDSTLNLYRRAIHLRRELQGAEELEWLETGRDDVLRYRRPDGWEVVTNFGMESVELGQGEVLISSQPISDGILPAETTAWIKVS
ncbi:alpha-amylase family glycosyl hydrolase [Actinomycetaceae bacterium MB13-C1-2]|nr:alpha-amylase family glycosyl hydrolase [Actinomycetaceae bacterium MB13-C1-2]